MRKVLVLASILGTVGLISDLAHAATVNVIHGINGRDLGAARALPVDIAVNGECALTGVRFGQQAAVEFAAGDYDITVHLSTGDCSSDAVISETVSIPETELEEDNRSFTAVASLTGRGTPQLKIFSDSFPLVSSAVTLRHVAFAPQVTVRSQFEGGTAFTSAIRNGREVPMGFWTDKAATYSYVVTAGKSSKPLLNLRGSVKVGTARLLHIVGSAKNGLRVVPVTVQLF